MTYKQIKKHAQAMTRLLFITITFKEPLAFPPYSLSVKLRLRSNESLSKLYGPRAKTYLEQT